MTGWIMENAWEEQVIQESKWIILKTLAEVTGLYTAFTLVYAKGATTDIEGYLVMSGKKAICFSKSLESAARRMREEADMAFILYGSIGLDGNSPSEKDAYPQEEIHNLYEDEGDIE